MLAQKQINYVWKYLSVFCNIIIIIIIVYGSLCTWEYKQKIYCVIFSYFFLYVFVFGIKQNIENIQEKHNNILTKINYYQNRKNICNVLLLCYDDVSASINRCGTGCGWMRWGVSVTICQFQIYIVCYPHAVDVVEYVEITITYYRFLCITSIKFEISFSYYIWHISHAYHILCNINL